MLFIKKIFVCKIKLNSILEKKIRNMLINKQFYLKKSEDIIVWMGCMHQSQYKMKDNSQ